MPHPSTLRRSLPMLGLLLFLAASLPGSHGAEEGTCPSQNSRAAISSSSSLLQAARTTFNDAAAVTDEGIDVLMLGTPTPDDVTGSSVPLRPYLVKTFKCSSPLFSTCVECYGGDELGDDCFNLQSEAGSELLQVKKYDNQSAFHHARVIFDCPHLTKFRVEAEVAVRGTEVRVSLNGKPVEMNLTSDSSGIQVMTFTAVDDLSTSSGRVAEFDMSMELYTGYSFAKVLRMKLHTTEDYIVCEDHRACLWELYSAGDAGIKLRNDNVAQLQCLEGMLPEDEVCSAWKECLNGSGTLEKIRTLLKAAGVTTSLELAQERRARAVVRHETSADNTTCIYPTIEDPESRLCTCVPTMESICNAMGGVSTETCFTALMCEDPCRSVCASWKTSMDCDNPELKLVRNAIRDHASLGLIARAHRSQHGLLSKGDLDSVYGKKIRETTDPNSNGCCS